MEQIYEPAEKRTWKCKFSSTCKVALCLNNYSAPKTTSGSYSENTVHECLLWWGCRPVDFVTVIILVQGPGMRALFVCLQILISIRKTRGKKGTNERRENEDKERNEAHLRD
jgi:hypothetical protein